MIAAASKSPSSDAPFAPEPDITTAGGVDQREVRHSAKSGHAAPKYAAEALFETRPESRGPRSAQMRVQRSGEGSPRRPRWCTQAVTAWSEC